MGVLRNVDLMDQCLLENVANFSGSYISTVTGCKEKRKKIARLQVHIYRRTHRGVKPGAGNVRAVLPAPNCVEPCRDPLASYWNVTRMRSGALGKEGECRSTENAPIRDVLRVAVRSWKYPLGERGEIHAEMLDTSHTQIGSCPRYLETIRISLKLCHQTSNFPGVATVESAVA